MADEIDDWAKRLGHGLRLYRERNGVSQVALAERVGVSQSVLDRAEKGHRTRAMQRISDWLAKNVDDVHPSLRTGSDDYDSRLEARRSNGCWVVSAVDAAGLPSAPAGSLLVRLRGRWGLLPTGSVLVCDAERPATAGSLGVYVSSEPSLGDPVQIARLSLDDEWLDAESGDPAGEGEYVTLTQIVLP